LPILSKKPTGQQPQHLQLDRDFAGRQILGSRDEQQDSYAFSIVEGDEKGADKLLVIVADGMGGHVGGREASLAAVSGFVDAFFEAIDAREIASESHAGGMASVLSKISDEESALTAQRPPPNAASAPPLPDSPSTEAITSPSSGQASVPPGPERASAPLKTALLAANLAVDKMIATDPDTLGEAGTTLVATVIERGSVRWISVGDSPLLLWRKGKLTRLNADHSMRAVFAEKVAVGQMRARDIATHPERNALLAVLNGLEILKIDDPVEPMPLVSGDMVIAASDGLLTLTVAEISKELKKLQKAPVLDVVRSLLEKVEKKANPKQDNTSIAIVRV
jgi:serine/threonine protein phosphatase PrpC